MTLEELKERIHYDPETGIFTWKIRAGRSAPLGSQAGTPNPYYGYLAIGVRGLVVNRVTHPAHRLAWFYMTGEWPPHDIDHINGIRTDNRLCNLRLATRGENLWNSKGKRPGQLKGIYYDKARNLWAADIMTAGKKRRLGRYATAEQAHAVYAAAALADHGEFARTK